MRAGSIAVISMVLLTLAGVGCKKKEAPKLSDMWVDVEVMVDAQFNILGVKQLMLVIDSVSGQGPNLGLPEDCTNLPTSGRSCSSLCADVDQDGHREMLVDCTGVGGISEGKKIAAMASAWGLSCVPHVACSSLGIVNLAANLHLIGSISNSPYVSYDAYPSPIRGELVEEPIDAVNGYVTIPDRPGLGVQMNERAVEQYLLG